MTIDLSLKNTALYTGCDIEEVAGRLNLKTPMYQAVDIVGGNIAAMLAAIPATERKSVTLTGPMAIPINLVVFHMENRLWEMAERIAKLPPKEHEQDLVSLRDNLDDMAELIKGLYEEYEVLSEVYEAVK